MERKVIQTGDGSFTLEMLGSEETYHSRHGAVQESQHVFISCGLSKVMATKREIRLLEIGFGTGLNALLTRSAIEGEQVKVHYTALETDPLNWSELSSLEYGQSAPGFELFYQELHTSSWDKEVQLSHQFTLEKRKASLQSFQTDQQFDLIYFDAFGPPTQPELWTLELFQKVAAMTVEKGVFVTYCAKGQVRRDLISAGFDMEKLKGPPGKRHMLRGVRR